MRLRSQSARTLLYEEVVEELYRLIDEKHIQPGGKLPPERELIEQLKVSRNVLREAFHVLETRGVIVSHQGKGRFLRAHLLMANFTIRSKATLFLLPFQSILTTSQTVCY